jgi:ATP-binding cassette, subfamily B (MDR/TAP), member 1
MVSAGGYVVYIWGLTMKQYLANAGQVINVFYAILIGSFTLAMLAPELQGLFNVIHGHYYTLTWGT